MATPHLHMMKQNSPMLKPELDNGNKMIGYWLVSLVLILAGSLIPFNAIIANFYGLDTWHMSFFTACSHLYPWYCLRTEKPPFSRPSP